MDVYRRQWRLLVLAGLVVFMPLGLIEAGVDLIDTGSLDDGVDTGTFLVLLGIAIGQSIAALLGEVIYAGVVAAAYIHPSQETSFRRIRELAGELLIGRLAAVDLLWVLVVAIGLVLLVIPGLVFIVWFALIAPAVEVENRGIRAAFGRSRELVRRRFWLVAGLVLPVIVIGDLLSDLLQQGAAELLHEGFVSDWLGSVVAGLITSPPYALIAVILFVGLRRPDEIE